MFTTTRPPMRLTRQTEEARLEQTLTDCAEKLRTTNSQLLDMTGAKLQAEDAFAAVAQQIEELEVRLFGT